MEWVSFSMPSPQFRKGFLFSDLIVQPCPSIAPSTKLISSHPIPQPRNTHTIPHSTSPRHSTPLIRLSPPHPPPSPPPPLPITPRSFPSLLHHSPPPPLHHSYPAQPSPHPTHDLPSSLHFICALYFIPFPPSLHPIFCFTADIPADPHTTF